MKKLTLKAVADMLSNLIYVLMAAPAILSLAAVVYMVFFATWRVV